MKLNRWLTYFMFMIVSGMILSCSGSGQNTDNRNISKSTLKLVGPEIPVSTVNDDQQNPHVIYLADKQLFFSVWEDWRNRNVSGADIYGQFLKPDGTMCSAAFPITRASGNQTVPQVAYRQDVTYGVDSKLVVTWQDTRGVSNGRLVLGTGNGATKVFTGTLSDNMKVKNNVKIIADNQVLTDDGLGTLSGIGGATGTVNYSTGAVTVTYAFPPVSGVEILAVGDLGYVYYEQIKQANIPAISTCDSFSAPAPTNGIPVNFNLPDENIPVPIVSAVNNSVLIGIGDGSKKTFAASSPLVSPVLSKAVATGYGSNVLTISVGGVVVLTDAGNGGLSGPNGSGTINYTTGALTVDFNIPPLADQQITVSYSYQTVTYSTYTRPNTSDYLYSRKMPKIVYDPVRDNFWLAWSESRSKINSFNELYFPGISAANAVISWEFGDTTFPGYAVIKGSDLSFDVSKMGVIGADVVRNKLTNTNRFIAGAYTSGLAATAEYEYFTNVTNVTLAVDTTSPEVLIAWDGLRNRGKLDVKCADTNANTYCDAGESVNSTFTTSPYESGLSHIYAVFDKEIARPVVYSRYLENPTPDGVVPGNQSKKPAAGFDPIFKRFLVVWEDMRDGKTNKIFGQLVNSGVGSYNSNIFIGFQDLTTSGSLDPNVAAASQTSPTVSYDSVNQRHFVAWQDGRNGQVSNENMDIYGQFVDGEGTLRGSNYAIVTNISNQLAPTITYNSYTNQFMAIWKDARNSTTSASDIYGQLFSLGQPQITLLKLDNTPLLPALLNFGSLSVSQFTSQSFKLRNTGDSNITLNSIIDPVDSTYSVVNKIPLLGVELVPGAEYVFSVKYAPTTSGTNVSSFTIKTDAGDRTVSLQGQGISGNQLKMNVDTLSQVTVPGDTSTTPVKVDAIDFGSLSLGTSSTKSMTIKNVGIIPYKITSISGIGTYSTIYSSSAGFNISSIDANSFPITLNPAQSITVSMVYWSPVADEKIQQIQINTDNPSLTQSVYLYGKTTAPTPNLSLTTLDFGSVSASPAGHKDLTFSISNSGNDTLKISSFGAVPNGFSIVSPTLPITIQPGNSSLVTVRFTPSENSSYSGAIAAASNDPLTTDSLTGISTLVINLKGTGTGPKLKVTPSQLDFGLVGANTNKKMSLTLLNTGNAPLTINSLAGIATPFTYETPGSLPIQLLPNTSVAVYVKYSPTVVGSNQSSIVINSDSIGGDQTIPLQGFTYLLNSGTVSMNPSPITFPSTAVGVTQSQNFVLTNTSLVPVVITNVDGPSSAFSIKNLPALPYTLDAGANLSLITSFNPSAAGSYNSNIGFLFDYLTSPVNISVSGTSGTTTASGSIDFLQSNASVSNNLAFNNVYVKSVSTQAITAKNSSASNITIVSATSSNPAFSTNLQFPFTLTSNTAANTKDFTVSFLPASKLPYTGTLTLKDTVGNLYQMALTGNGSSVNVTVDTSSEPNAYVSNFTQLLSTQYPTAGKPANLNVSNVVDMVIKGVTSGRTVSVTVAVDSIPTNAVFYKISNNKWVQFTPDSIDSVNKTVTYRVKDSVLAGDAASEMDSDPTPGVIHDPVVIASFGATSTGTGTTPPPSSGGGSGCFIATAAFGSYLDPHVMALRHFRDNVLLQSELGTEFVKFYYKYSPPIADFIAQHDALRLIMRLVLTPLIFAVKYPLTAVFLVAFAIVWFLKRKQVFRSNEKYDNNRVSLT